MTAHEKGVRHMSFDFRSLSTGRSFTSLTSPRDIFNALPRKKLYLEYLRDGQGRVLDLWEQRRTERDLVIKLNTGGGKTVVSLLILQACINEGYGPALYVAPDSFLVSQVRAQAEDLGIATVDDPDDKHYLSCLAVAVVNVHKLINGLSVFGGPGNTRPTPVPIGSVVIDDVHAALMTAEDQCTISLPAEHPLYEKVLTRFERSLEEQAPNRMLALRDKDPALVPLLVPFWAWHEHSGDLAPLMQTNKDDDHLKWQWPLIREQLPICRCAIGSKGLEIRPSCLPINEIRSFRGAKRRLFLTATLADDSPLVTAFDADPDCIARPITPESAADLGDRMILAPQQITPDISEDNVRAAVGELAATHNVVVIVPSAKRANFWAQVAQITATKDEIGAAVERLKGGHVGLVVLINKYDGIDLPDEGCRVLVIDSLPEVYGQLAQRDASILSETDTLLGRQMQRIEQGMGRGVRGANDYCVVLLLGHRLAQCVATPSLRRQFSELTEAQLALSVEVASLLEGRPMEDLLAVINQSLDRDPGWLDVSRKAVAGTRYAPGRVSSAAVAERNAYNRGSVQQFPEAVNALSEAANKESDDGIYGILKESMASYADFYDKVTAQQILSGALSRNARMLRPLRGFSYSRAVAHADQARSVSLFLESRYQKSAELLIGIRAVLDALVFDPDGTVAFENAMEELGQWLGFRSQRPERDSGNGPDVLWAVGGLHYLIIECKSGVTTDDISRKSVEQLAHSVAWFDETYDKTCTARPLIVHPSEVLV
jgi:hypothetical protein